MGKGEEMEYRDLYNADRQKLGKAIEKGQPVPEGCRILVVIMVVENDKGQLLLQKRSVDKGGQWAFTGGHPKSGQNSVEGIMEEAKEEIGLNLLPKDLTLFHTIKTDKTFIDLYYVKNNSPAKDFVIQQEEVQDVQWASREQIAKYISTDMFFAPHLKAYQAFQDWEREKDLI